MANGSGQGVWTPVELANDGSGTWRGTLAVASTRATYVIQAADNRGNVTWLDYVSAQRPSSGVPLGIAQPVDVTVAPPPAPTNATITRSQGKGTIVNDDP